MHCLDPNANTTITSRKLDTESPVKKTDNAFRGVPFYIPPKEIPVEGVGLFYPSSKIY